MKEYKIIQGTESDCQKWLNQWRHEFNLEILEMNTHYMKTHSEFRCIILLIREKKP